MMMYAISVNYMCYAFIHPGRISARETIIHLSQTRRLVNGAYNYQECMIEMYLML